jgi:hypothetical protein
MAVVSTHAAGIATPTAHVVTAASAVVIGIVARVATTESVEKAAAVADIVTEIWR